MSTEGTPAEGMPVEGGKGMPSVFARLARAALAAILLAPLGACALADVASGPAPSLYVLTAPSPDLPGAPLGASVQLGVQEFQAPSAIDTGRIVFQPSPNEIKYYAGARWSDRAPRMIAALLVETLAGTGRLPAVLGPESQARKDFALVGDIRAFGAYRPESAGLGEGTTRVRVAFFVRLVRARGGIVLASREFSAEAPAASGAMSDIVAAYNAALGAVLGEVAGWTLDEAALAVNTESKPAS